MSISKHLQLLYLPILIFWLPNPLPFRIMIMLYIYLQQY
nr:MAG TPA: hypothetical protein [Bacteriophage sp.]